MTAAYSVNVTNPNQQIEPLMNYNERFQNEINQSFKDNNEGFNNQIVDPYAPGGPLKIKDEEKVSAVGYEGFTNGVDYMQQDPTSCFKRDRLTKDDLLPKDANLKWAQINPSTPESHQPQYLGEFARYLDGARCFPLTEF